METHGDRFVLGICTYTLSQNWALRLDYNHRDRDNDVVFSMQAFF
jgi:hypothetical protein